MVATVTRKDKDWIKKQVKRMESVDETVCAVGFPIGTSGTSTKYPDGTSVLMVAAVQQFGSVSRKIPARKFMTVGGAAAVEATKPIIQALIPALNAGKAKPEQILNDMGPFAVGAIQKTIQNGRQFEPNKASTVRRKKSSNPLNDTGLMRQTVTFVVRKTK